MEDIRWYPHSLWFANRLNSGLACNSVTSPAMSSQQFFFITFWCVFFKLPLYSWLKVYNGEFKTHMYIHKLRKEDIPGLRIVHSHYKVKPWIYSQTDVCTESCGHDGSVAVLCTTFWFLLGGRIPHIRRHILKLVIAKEIQGTQTST